MSSIPWPVTTVRADRLAAAVSGRVVLVTGASAGIGRATALRLGAAGAHVLLAARRADELEALAAEIGPGAEALACDLADAAAVDELIATVAERHGGIDVLVNNAGHSIRRTLARSPNAAGDAERLMTINYLAAVRLITGFLPALRERGGQVVSISSMATQTGAPGFAAYTASKAALDAFTRTAAMEPDSDAVAFTTVHMPLVRTAMIEPSPGLVRLPALSAGGAAELVAHAVVHRPPRIGTPVGELAAIGWALNPSLVTTLERALRRLPVPAAASLAASGRTSPRRALAGLLTTTGIWR